MSGVQPKEHPDPLKETPRYVKIADLSSGSFGFVQLARNTETNELVAIKFIERGDRCGPRAVQGARVGPGMRAARGAPACKTLWGGPAPAAVLSPERPRLDRIPPRPTPPHLTLPSTG
jgi:hypothetical protein